VKPLGVLAAALVLLAVGCGEASLPRRVAEYQAPRSCPQNALPGWQRLANRIDAPVYCPAWMPYPLDARIGGAYANGESVSRDRSYLVSFLWREPGSGEVHVNLRGYVGKTRIPTCSDLDTNKPVRCFSDRKGTVRAGGIAARVYTANQGADQWHVLYAWRRGGSLYAISEHVAPPNSYARVIRNLNRMLRGLVLIQPRT
jgi:hypothetical protein